MKNLLKVVSIATLISTSAFADGSVPSNCEEKVISRVQNLIGSQTLTLRSESKTTIPEHSNLSPFGSSNKYIQFTLNNEVAGFVAAEVALLDSNGVCMIQDMVVSEISINE